VPPLPCTHGPQAQRLGSPALARAPPAAQAPPTLAIAEAVSITLVYLLAVPNAVPTRTGRLHYTFPGSAEDVVALSLLRCVAIAAAQVLGGGTRFQRCVGLGEGAQLERGSWHQVASGGAQLLGLGCSPCCFGNAALSTA